MDPLFDEIIFCVEDDNNRMIYEELLAEGLSLQS